MNEPGDHQCLLVHRRWMETLHKTSKSNKTKRQQHPVSLPFDCQSTNKRAEVKVLDAKTQSLLGKQCYKTNVIKSQQAQGQKGILNVISLFFLVGGGDLMLNAQDAYSQLSLFTQC